MEAMFEHALMFNQEIDTMEVTFNDDTGVIDVKYHAWNTSNVTDMGTMFYNARAFNRSIINWNTAGVTVMDLMFSGVDGFINTSTRVRESVANWNTDASRGVFDT